MLYTRRETMHAYTLIYQWQRRAQKEENSSALDAISVILNRYLRKFDKK